MKKDKMPQSSNKHLSSTDGKLLCKKRNFLMLYGVKKRDAMIYENYENIPF
jgi:hypothetical protein